MKGLPRSAASPLRPRPYVCPRCVQCLRPPPQRRFPSTIHRVALRKGFQYKVAEKEAQDEAEWQEKARAIRAGEQNSMLKILEERGFVHALTEDRDKVEELLTKRRIGAYVGIDPTAESLHVGHLVPLMALLWLYLHGYRAVTLLGGATAQFGDPTGREKTREAVHSDVRQQRMVLMHVQLRRLWDNMHKHATTRFGHTRHKAWRRALLNNNTWLNGLGTVEFLKLAGRPQRVNDLLRRDTAQTKFKGAEGLSFAELAYPLLQGWDWFHLFERLGVQLQIGGQDQFGNITAGLDVVNTLVPAKINQRNWPERYGPDARRVGMTVPLLTTAAGEKFGKTTGGQPVWLSAELTSPFELHQFFLRTADADVARYLRLFTLLPLPDIAALMAEQAADPGARPAQHRLAHEVLTLLHGRPEAEKLAFEQGQLFRRPTAAAGAPASPLSTPHPADASPRTNPNAPQTNAETALTHTATLPAALVRDRPFGAVLHALGLAASKSEAQRLMVGGGAYVGGRSGPTIQIDHDVKWVPVRDARAGAVWPYVLDGQTLFVRVGKWRVKVVRLLDDDAWRASGLEAPPGVAELLALDPKERAAAREAAERTQRQHYSAHAYRVERERREREARTGRAEAVRVYHRQKGTAARREALAREGPEEAREQRSREWQAESDPNRAARRQRPEGWRAEIRGGPPPKSPILDWWTRPPTAGAEADAKTPAKTSAGAKGRGPR